MALSETQCITKFDNLSQEEFVLRKIIQLRYILFGATLLVSTVSSAQRATDVQMSEEAAMSLFFTSDRSAISESAESSRIYIRDQAALDAQKGNTVSATIVFIEGMPAEEIDTLLRVHQLELIRAEMKHPVGNEGKVFTISIGARSLLLKTGSVANKLRQSIGAEQLSLFQSLGEPESENEYLEVIFEPNPRYYKIEVMGNIESIQNLTESNEIRVVLMDNDMEKVNDFIREKNMIEQWKENSPPTVSRRLEDGLPPGVLPGQLYRADRMPDIETLFKSQNQAARPHR